MKMLFILTSCLALTLWVGSAEGQQGSPAPKKKPTGSVQTTQHGPATGGHAIGGGVRPQPHAVAPTGRTTGAGRSQFQQTKPSTTMTKPATTAKPTTTTKPTTATTQTNLSAKARLAASGHAQHFDLPKKSTQPVTGVTFKQGSHISGSQNWRGPSYAAFRNYTPQWHDAGWWRIHNNRIVVIVVVINEVPFNNFFFFDAGFWFPAWGYDPNSTYPYDGPIYGYNGLPPDQVVANVQAALQAQGYYNGPIDGVLGPLTRAGLADYQRDHGLYITSAVDQPTMASLGFV